jgi:hypothetical protein
MAAEVSDTGSPFRWTCLGACPLCNRRNGRSWEDHRTAWGQLPEFRRFERPTSTHQAEFGHNRSYAEPMCLPVS